MSVMTLDQRWENGHVSKWFFNKRDASTILVGMTNMSLKDQKVGRLVQDIKLSMQKCFCFDSTSMSTKLAECIARL